MRRSLFVPILATHRQAGSLREWMLSAAHWNMYCRCPCCSATFPLNSFTIEKRAIVISAYLSTSVSSAFLAVSNRNFIMSPASLPRIPSVTSGALPSIESACSACFCTSGDFPLARPSTASVAFSSWIMYLEDSRTLSCAKHRATATRRPFSLDLLQLTRLAIISGEHTPSSFPPVSITLSCPSAMNAAAWSLESLLPDQVVRLRAPPSLMIITPAVSSASASCRICLAVRRCSSALLEERRDCISRGRSSFVTSISVVRFFASDVTFSTVFWIWLAPQPMAPAAAASYSTELSAYLQKMAHDDESDGLRKTQ
mmetsp:Transcript_54528/g.173264  ORF Transcript_54528/g.173264 Transcript_54528/m.173264 type:complete len:313 (+) Transcript_54528:681-1619(+)